MPYSPNLFGSQEAMKAWRKITSILDYEGDDDFQQGDRPLMHLISKTQLKRSKSKLVKKVTSDPDTYVPGLLIIGFLLMQKGLPLSSDFKIQMRTALADARLRLDRVPNTHQSQRKRQLSHLDNLIDGEYKPSDKGTRVLLYYGSDKERKRAHKRDKRIREQKKRKIRYRKQMSEEDIKAFAFTYMLMKIFNSGKKTKKLFQTYAPHVNVTQLCTYMYNEGLCDAKCRPNDYFLNRINTLLIEKKGRL
jgi:hypothetical protein